VFYLEITAGILSCPFQKIHCGSILFALIVLACAPAARKQNVINRNSNKALKSFRFLKSFLPSQKA
jgi:hypothetical protein